MSDDVVADAVVDIGGQNALFDQVLLGTVGPEADDSLRPGACHAGDFQQLVESGMIQVDAILGADCGFPVRWRIWFGALADAERSQQGGGEDEDGRT